MTAPVPRHRRAPTRWYLVGAVAIVAAVLGGAWWLEAIHPQLDATGNAVEGVPPLALDDDPTCRRLVEEPAIEEVRARLLSDAAIAEIREAVRPGGRISSAQLYLCPSAYDGLEVTFVGEVIGDVLRRRGGAWVQVNDDDYALVTGPLVGHRERSGFNSGLSVWLEGDLADRIEQPGRAALRGDIVLLQGRVFRADPDDGGGITLRAHTLETLAPPLELDPPLHVVQLVVAVVLAAAAIGATLYARLRRER